VGAAVKGSFRLFSDGTPEGTKVFWHSADGSESVQLDGLTAIRFEVNTGSVRLVVEGPVEGCASLEDINSSDAVVIVLPKGALPTTDPLPADDPEPAQVEELDGTEPFGPGEEECTRQLAPGGGCLDALCPVHGEGMPF
jgi:hypothetical protein